MSSGYTSQKVPLPSERLAFGHHAEQLVAQFMIERGMHIVARNARVGRDELDIVALDCTILVFCEVRASSRFEHYDPIETIDSKKIACIRRGAGRWIAEHQPRARGIRFDAASVVIRSGSARIAYYEEAF